MSQTRKSLLTAYILWLFLAPLGVHRFYLLRPMSGAFLCLMNLAGILTLVVGTTQNSPEYSMVGGTCLIGVLCWVILDAFFIPSMVAALNEPDGPRSYVSLAAVDMDPSFSATLGQARVERTGEKRSGLPEGYEMPWRKERERPTVVRYRSED